MREIYRLRQAIEEIFRGLQQELGWTGHRHWRRARLLAHLALGLVAYGLIERQREGLGLSFYQCRRRVVSRCMCKRLCTGGIPLLKHLL
jgi:putative transposase